MTSTETRLNSLLLERENLSPDLKEGMFRLLSDCFDGITRDGFETDLAEKNWVILLLDEGGVAGFSTLCAYERDFGGQRINVVYSGDTIVDPRAWGTSTLPRTWIASVNRIVKRMSGVRSYWLLISSGFRTYRFLPLFWREFYPRFDRETPSELERLRCELARDRFGSCFDGDIVRFPLPQKLSGKLSEVPEERLRDPHISFFIEKNPGHASGDELVCLTELDPANLTRAGLRMVQDELPT